MKIYTNRIDIAQAAEYKFWTAPYSDHAFGLKIVKDGEPVDNEFSVFDGDTQLVAQTGTVDGYTVFKATSGATGSKVYTVEVAGVAEKFTVINIVSDSTVFEKDAASGGGGGAEYTAGEGIEIADDTISLKKIGWQEYDTVGGVSMHSSDETGLEVSPNGVLSLTHVPQFFTESEWSDVSATYEGTEYIVFVTED